MIALDVVFPVSSVADDVPKGSGVKMRKTGFISVLSLLSMFDISKKRVKTRQTKKRRRKKTRKIEENKTRQRKKTGSKERVQEARK